MQIKSNSSVAQVWSQPNCPACEEAKRLLELHKIQYAVCELGNDTGYTKKDLIELVPTARSVPQIFVNGFHVGGLLELKRLLNDNNQRVKME